MVHNTGNAHKVPHSTWGASCLCLLVPNWLRTPMLCRQNRPENCWPGLDGTMCRFRLNSLVEVCYLPGSCIFLPLPVWGSHYLHFPFELSTFYFLCSYQLCVKISGLAIHPLQGPRLPFNWMDDRWRPRVFSKHITLSFLAIMAFMNFYFALQFNVHYNENNRLLDLVFSNIPHCLRD